MIQLVKEITKRSRRQVVKGWARGGRLNGEAMCWKW
jgi:hypothetical protein